MHCLDSHLTCVAQLGGSRWTNRWIATFLILLATAYTIIVNQVIELLI